MSNIKNNDNFSKIISIIENAKMRALKAVNTELITMYYEVGKYLSELCSKAKFGDKVINDVEMYISKNNPTNIATTSIAKNKAKLTELDNPRSLEDISLNFLTILGPSSE